MRARSGENVTLDCVVFLRQDTTVSILCKGQDVDVDGGHDDDDDHYGGHGGGTVHDMMVVSAYGFITMKKYSFSICIIVFFENECAICIL